MKHHRKATSILTALLVPALGAAALTLSFPSRAFGEEGKVELVPERTKEDSRRVALEAMKAELKRSMEKVRLEAYDAPYFISYQLKDISSHGIRSRYGAIFDDRSIREAKLAVDVRVGTHEFDSSEGGEEMPFFLTGSGPTYMAQADAPHSTDPHALRNALWLLTDEKYKSAVSNWLKRKAQSIYAADEEERGVSLSKEAPVRHVEEPIPFPFEKEKWTGVAREISALFRDYPEIFDSEVRVTADKQIRIQVNSEGSELITEETLYAVHVQAVTRATDGQLLDNSRDFYAATEGELPDFEAIRVETGRMIGELLALRLAPVIDPYTGPAILAPEATGVLFHETIGHRLEGERQHDDNEGRTFKGQVGNRVLPSFLSIVDDPTRRTFGDKSLNGFYRYDDEAVPGQKTVLIEKGILRNYLLSRKTVKGFEKSNGHGRAQSNRKPVARMANLFVESSRQVPYAKLRKMLLDEARKANKPYALIIRDITGGNTNTSTYGYQAFKGVPRMVYRVDVKTGKEELVRGVEIVGTPLTSINKIVATGDEYGIFNGFCGAESGYVPVSTVAPAALISELELQRTVKANERSTIVPSPWALEKAK